MASRKTYIHKNQTGFSLIEVLVTMALFVIIMTFGLFVSMDAYRTYSFRAERNTVVSLFQKARNQAMANVDQKPHGVHIDYAANPKTYTLFEGTDYASRTQNLDAVFTISSQVTPSGMTDIVFSQLTGQAMVSGGNLTLKSSGHPDSVISINNEGRIDF